MNIKSVTSSIAHAFLVNLKYDLPASIVVFLVALPICMGVAIASGAPADIAAAVGILTGIVGGMVVGTFAGSPLQVSGPAAGLAVIVGQLVAQYGYETLGILVIIAGVVQLLAGLVGIGQWFRAISPSVIQGMLAGIGVLIFAAQFHVMVDDQPPGSGREFGGIVNLVTIPHAVWKGVSEDAHRDAAVIGVLTIAVTIAWTVMPPNRFKVLPAPLVGVAIATAVTAIVRLDPKFINVPDRLLDAVALPTAESMRNSLNWSVIGSGIALAFVASAESLLTATAGDAQQTHAPRTKYDRELAAQGIGNVLCGFLGILPMTGVIVRTTANIQAGARTRLSTILHGLQLLILAELFPHLLRFVPISSLAGVLVFTGYKLLNIGAVKKVYKDAGKSEVAIYLATFGVVVVVDLLTGIMVGIGLALAKLVYTFSHLSIGLEQSPRKRRTVLYLEGAATFVRLPKLAAALETIPRDTELHVHVEQLTYIDHACLELLMNWEREHVALGGKLQIDWESMTAKFREYGKRNGNGVRRNGTEVEARAHTLSDVHGARARP